MKKILFAIILLFTIIFSFSCKQNDDIYIANNIKTKNINISNVNIPVEIKFLLDSNNVLNDNKEINDTYKEIFAIKKNPKINNVIYIDTENLDFHNNGWTNRIRTKDKKNEYYITYKKRYKIENNNIDIAIENARNDGFYDIEPELDWGYSEITLSYSFDKTISNIGDNADLSSLDKNMIISYLKDNLPILENGDNNNGIELLDYVSITPAICYKKYSGNFDDKKISIEVWPIYTKTTDKIEYITELSLKCDNINDASSLKEQMDASLNDLCILLHEDSLKTNKVLSTYFNNN